VATAPVDIPVQIKGLSDLQKLERRMEALEKEVTRLNTSLPKTGKAATAAGTGAAKGAVGVKAFGAAIKTALGPISLALSAIGGLGAAFNAIKGQDFSEAKFESLGGNATQLVTNLKAVSNELQGSASVAELTAAAYDVASAGFSSAAEASLVLKAASLGATGGFSDINTVGNAATSVLNAYGQSATDAAKLVDQFIQTQNDGKIVVAEYANNIGKVASAAAGLGVPLSEVNAVIAQATASGVQAEVAFTGLKGALAKLASGQASKELEQFGINIDAASIEADGLLGTLKKLEGLDTGTLFKALGTEAAPALLPVIQNLERYEELIKNQEQANGVAAAAAATAAGTIEGAWKRVTVAFQNLFADQTELGQIIRFTLLAAAATVEALGAAFTLAIAPIRALIEVIMGITSALTGVKDGEAVLQSFTKKWFEVISAVQDVANTIVAIGNVVGQYIGALVQEVAQWFSGLWNSISSGVQNVVGAITGAFSTAFQGAKSIIEGFWNSLPDWLKGALSTAASVAGGVTDAVRGALEKVVGDVQEAKAKVEITVPNAPKTPAINAVIPTGGVTGGGNSGGGGVGGANEAAKKAEAMKEQLAAAEKLVTAALREQDVLKTTNDLEKAKVESANRMFEIAEKYGQLATKALSDTERETLLKAQGLEIQNERLSLEQQLADIQESATASIDEEIARLQAVIAGKEEEYKWTKMIKDLEAKGVTDAAARVSQLQALTAEAEAVENLKSQYESLASGIASEMTSAFRSIIDGSKSAEEAMADMFKGIADKFLDMAMKMLQDAIVQQLMQLIPALFGGGPAVPLNVGTTMPFGGASFEGGGYTGDGARSGGVDGRGGFPAILHPNETVVDHTQARARYNGGNESIGPMAERPIQVKYQSTSIAGQNYVTEEQFQAGMAQATKEGAKKGESRVYASLRNSRSRRSSLGLG
jgi:TP901 family phage tail tape measure protein